MNRAQFVYKPCTSFTNLASGVQNWRFVYKYSLFNLQTSILPYKLVPQITTQLKDDAESSVKDDNQAFTRFFVEIAIANHYNEIKEFLHF